MRTSRFRGWSALGMVRNDTSRQVRAHRQNYLFHCRKFGDASLRDGFGALSRLRSGTTRSCAICSSSCRDAKRRRRVVAHERIARGSGEYRHAVRGNRRRVFRSISGGGDWAGDGAGLPPATIVTALSVQPGSPIRLATYGRGAYEFTRRAARTRETPIRAPGARAR